MNRAVAVILARGGSQGIPRKNLTDFCGKPLLAWTIEHAQAARRIDSVWVSSDDPEILATAEALGARLIPRPAEISDAVASSESGWMHAVEALEAQGEVFDLMVAPQCTSPVREARDFDGALALFDDGTFDSLFAATLTPDLNLWRAKANGKPESFTYDYRRRERRQEKPVQWLENGSFWIFKPSVLREHANRMGGRIGVFEMDFWKSFQIDEPDDLRFCETLMRAYLPGQLTEGSGTG